MSVVLGTSGVVFAVLPAYKPDAQARVHVFCHAVPGTWHAMGVMLSAAGSLAWLRRVVGADYGVLDDEAARWPPGAEGLLFAPYLAGERTPHADPDARGAFTGLSLRHDRGALARATLEGVAYGLRDSLELLRELGVRPEVGRASGGGATSDLWLRIVASVLGLPLERTESEEGSAFGAALLAGVRAGVFEDAADAVARCVRVRDRIEPDPEWSAAYERGYERYRLLYPNLRSLEDRTGSDLAGQTPLFLRAQHDFERGAAPGSRAQREAAFDRLGAGAHVLQALTGRRLRRRRSRRRRR